MLGSVCCIILVFWSPWKSIVHREASVLHTHVIHEEKVQPENNGHCFGCSRVFGFVRKGQNMK